MKKLQKSFLMISNVSVVIHRTIIISFFARFWDTIHVDEKVFVIFVDSIRNEMCKMMTTKCCLMAAISPHHHHSMWKWQVEHKSYLGLFLFKLTGWLYTQCKIYYTITISNSVIVKFENYISDYICEESRDLKMIRFDPFSLRRNSNMFFIPFFYLQVCVIEL